MNASSEMSLYKYLEGLPPGHRARNEFASLVDLAKYSFHESMLPHHFSKYESDWRSTRVAIASQNLLSDLQLDHGEPSGYQLLTDSPEWEKHKVSQQKGKPSWLSRLFDWLS